MFNPGLAADAVFPDGVWAGLGLWVVRVLATIQPERVVGGVEVAERDSRRAARLRQAGQGRAGDLPRLGQVKGKKIVCYS